MPLYEYTCPRCGAEIERYASKYRSCAEDIGQVCGEAGCFGALDRVEISEQLPPNLAGGYQMTAIMSDGSKVAGHFGKSAASKGARHGTRGGSRKGENTKAIVERLRSEGIKVKR